MSTTAAIEQFWQDCRSAVPGLTGTAPQAWAFGATPAQADDLLALVLSGTKSATASSLWDYEAADEALPQVGELSIVLDGQGKPRALLETTSVVVLPFEQVSQAHAFAEGEGDRSLEYWRSEHEQFWRSHSANPKGFAADMPVVCERFRLSYSQTDEG